MKIEPFKMRVTPEQSEVVQGVLGHEPKNTNRPYLSYRHDTVIIFNRYDTDFKKISLPELSYSDFIDRYDPYKVGDSVVWNERIGKIDDIDIMDFKHPYHVDFGESGVFVSAKELRRATPSEIKAVEQPDEVQQLNIKRANTKGPYAIPDLSGYQATVVCDPPKDDFFTRAYKSLCKMQQAKDRKYGNSALKPLDIFAKHHPYGSRIDEKLARVKNSDTLCKNDVADIIGGLMLLCQDKGWDDFSDLID